jgi:hypothetical protein
MHEWAGALAISISDHTLNKRTIRWLLDGPCMHGLSSTSSFSLFIFRVFSLLTVFFLDQGRFSVREANRPGMQLD